MRYQIICMSKRVDLEDLVESEILEGWIPQGGVSMIQDSSKKRLWTQALIHPSLEMDKYDIEKMERRLRERALNGE